MDPRDAVSLYPRCDKLYKVANALQATKPTQTRLRDALLTEAARELALLKRYCDDAGIDLAPGPRRPD